eukprot:TRINITY_DN105_c0_g1_i1.p1 TRINITY_DN105_c0_g1~~TRINITY_DN105_c0_g1_i1.p1  ORF type:complete len:190 (+),score=51.69 TRINITY_DN105_c0_g1_i1:119-688(+)
MGGNNVKGLYWMETMFPDPSGRSVIPPEKLQKEIEKGTIKPFQRDEKDVDGDMDDYIDKVIREVWNFYDPKGTNMIPKALVQKFFKDALEIYAMRKGAKSSKEVLGPGVKYNDALTECVGKMTQTGQCSFKDFEEFLNCYDLEEALGPFLGIREVTINNRVEFVNVDQFKEQAAQPKKVQYRDYSGLEN